MFYRKQKLAGLSTRCFILSFFLRNVLKTVGKPLQLLTMHPKLIFRSALKKALMVPDRRSHQIQYFTKIFPSPLILTWHIHFYLHFQESNWNELWIVITLKSETFSAPKSAPETALETMYFMLLKNLAKNLEKKLFIRFVLMEMINFRNTFLFLHPTSFFIRETSPAMHGWRKVVSMNSHLYFFSLRHFRLFTFIKNYY